MYPDFRKPLKTKSTAQPKHFDNSWLGNMNALIESFVIWNGRKLAYNGTKVDQINTLRLAGAQDGDSFVECDSEKMLRFYSAPHETRTNGFWATSWNLAH